MQLIGLTVLCMVNSVWDIKAFLKRLWLYLNTNTLWWRMSVGPPIRNTLPGITNIATPIAKSTLITQASHIPVILTMPERDIVEPVSSERARTAYLE